MAQDRPPDCTGSWFPAVFLVDQAAPLAHTKPIKAATELVTLHPKVGMYMLRPPKADTYMASDLASNFLLLQFCAISGHMWATLFAQLLERLTADQRVFASSESTLHRQIVSNASCKHASTS